MADRGYSEVMNYSDRITIEPGKRSGKPCIRGLRITVSDILEYLASGMTEEEILAEKEAATGKGRGNKVRRDAAGATEVQ